MKKRIDPVTGDMLSFGEYISWLIQGVIRRWTFLLVISGITIGVWLTNNPTALLWWNLAASYLAIFIESVVGLAMFQQTRRDAVIIRRIEQIEAHTSAVVDRIDQIVERGEQDGYSRI